MVRLSVCVLVDELCCNNNTGFRMSCMKDEVLNEASVDLIDSFAVISSSDTFKVSKVCATLLGLIRS